jgi:Carbohydrate esterase, sialic acid-specific acetylesterase
LNSDANVDRLDPRSSTFRDTSHRLSADLTPFTEAEISRGARRAVILGLGASNIANEGEAAGCYTPVNPIANFNFLDGKAYLAKDPLLGASRNRGNFLTRLADMLVQRGAFANVMLVPVGYGATYAKDWAPGGIVHGRLTTAIERLQTANLAITHILYQQGEAEAAVQNQGVDGAAWVQKFWQIVDSIRARSVAAPIYVAQATICRNEANNIIRKAQRGVVDPTRAIMPGPDTDTISLDERWDGCHFSKVGLVKAAELWFETIAGT